MHITTTMNSEYCPFCNIASTYPPQSPLTFHPGTTTTHDDRVLPPLAAETSEGTNSFPSQSQSHAYVILSTKSILAFLDIMPLTRGHVLVVPREHCPTLGDVGVRVGRELGQWLPIISRATMKAIFGDTMDADAHWNVVQNNGVRAAQVVPHVHFHIVPRPPLDRPMPSSYIMFGRGQRDELDEEEGEKVAAEIRGELAREILRIKDVEGVDLDVGDSFQDVKKGGTGKL